jgi:glycosyltransferase involved in cell wall biosynthesis
MILAAANEPGAPVINAESLSLAVGVEGADLPLITVVTVVFNGVQFLEETIQSVINQTYPNIEYIIIDGGSTDGTLEIIRKYEHAIDYWMSEKDEGIYDAMNEGINAATGRWINFMNAGDLFFSADSISNIFQTSCSNATVVYGDVNARYQSFSKIIKVGQLSRMWMGMQFCHQSAFVLTSYHQANKFNIKNRVAADLEFFFRCYQNGLRFQYVNVIVSTFSTGGVSESNRIRTILACRDAVCMTQNTAKVKLVYFLLFINALMRIAIKKILPIKLTSKIIQLKS